MQRTFWTSLIVRMSILIIVVEGLILFALGGYYRQRFAREVDQRLETQVQLPGKLMNRQLSRYEAVTDRTIMTDLVGEEFVDGLVIGADRKIFYALHPEQIGKDVATLPGIEPHWIDRELKTPRFAKLSDARDTFLVSITPVVAYEGAQPFFFVYIKVRTTYSERAKTEMTRLFLLGSLGCMVFSSIALIGFVYIVITRPLSDLEGTANQLAQGHLDREIVIARRDEIGRLAWSFTQMRDAIRQKIQQLEELNRTLEQKVTERTAKVQETVNLLQQEIVERKRAEVALQHAKDAAEAANLAKSVFLANMSHELRTPLNGILGYAQILSRHHDLSASIQDGLNVIYQSGCHLLTLINDILDLAKIEARKLELYPEDFQLSHFLDGLVGIMRMRAQQKNVRFVVDLGPQLPSIIQADEKRLRQVLLNLLGNAVKFTNSGGTVTFRVIVPHPTPLPPGDGGPLPTPLPPGEGDHLPSPLRRGAGGEVPLPTPLPPGEGGPLPTPLPLGEGDHLPSPTSPHPSRKLGEGAREGWAGGEVLLRFEVADTGVGMTAEQLQRIFKPFEQVGDVQRRAEGTGLGLTISQQLVELMGGAIQVTSAPGQGSTFWFEAAFSASIVNLPKSSAGQGEIIGYTSERRQKILVVDDHRDIRLMLRDLLEPLGFDVTLAEDGQDGVNQAHASRPDGILMDLMMPVMTGFEAVQTLRQQPEFQQTPIIAISASVFDMDQAQSRAAGCDAFLGKPIAVPLLLEHLQHLLRLTWRYRESAENIESQETPAEFILPPASALETLHGSAQIGDILELRKQLSDLAQGDGRFIPFVRTFQPLVQQMKIAKIREFLEGCLAQSKTESVALTEIVPPSPEELAALYEFAVLGKVFEIQAYVERLKIQDVRYQPFAQKIWALAQAFEVSQIAALVKHYLAQSDNT